MKLVFGGEVAGSSRKETIERLFSQVRKGTWRDELVEAELMPGLEDQSETRPVQRRKGLAFCSKKCCESQS